MGKIKAEASGARPLPLGTRVEGGSVYVSFISEVEGTARFHLYKKGREQEAGVFAFPKECRLGNIRYVTLSGFDPAAYEYSLSVDGAPVRDLCAAVVTGREKWGEPGGPIRYGFLKEGFDWGLDQSPDYSFENTVLYRLHVRGFTKHPSSGVKNKGTFAGIQEKIPYLKELGVTMVELMVPDEFAEGGEGGRINYWGYGPAYCFAPKASYCVKGGKEESPDIQFKKLVKAFHENGMELAVELYFGPDMGTPLQLACLRHWVREYHVDGIHLSGNFDSRAAAADPALARVKLFAGDFCTGVSDRNRHLACYREDFQTDMRRLLKGDEDMLQLAAYQMKEDGGAVGKVNFMANTNGFTMADMVSYDRKHNEANGENGRDGSDYNHSWNCGAEGPVRKKRILELRKKQLRNAWVLLTMSQGIPLILAGDECGNSQDGNNNAYCQDNPTGWVNWKGGKFGEDVFQFASHMLQFRKAHPMLHKEGGLKGMDYLGTGCPDFSVHGVSPWYPQYEAYRRQLGFYYSGRYAEDGDIYLMLNMHWEPHTFSIPHGEGAWRLVVDTSREDKNGVFDEPELLENQETFELEARSIVVLLSDRKKKEEASLTNKKGRTTEKAVVRKETKDSKAEK
ncbi:MAG: alpha-amylase [Lachnospiraceae bacterium]|nr:alpha-amylase [Lachnospiraceae bacterium]